MCDRLTSVCWLYSVFRLGLDFTGLMYVDEVTYVAKISAGLGLQVSSADSGRLSLSSCLTNADRGAAHEETCHFMGDPPFLHP